MTISSALFLGISIGIVFNVINFRKQKADLKQLEELLYSEYDNKIRNEVETVISLLENLKKMGEKDNLTETETIELAKKIIRDMRYTKSGYFFADFPNGDNVIMLGRDDIEQYADNARQTEEISNKQCDKPFKYNCPTKYHGIRAAFCKCFGSYVSGRTFKGQHILF